MFSLIEKLFDPKSNAPEAAKLLSDILQVKITSTTLTKEIEGHPDYPSLLSISDVLNQYGIENLAIRLDTAKLSEAPVPFIASLKQEHGAVELFSVVKKITADKVSFFDPIHHTWITASRDIFLKRFSGTILLAEAGKHAGEKDYNKNIQQEKRTQIFRQLGVFCIPGIALVTGVIGLIQHGTASLLPFAFLIQALLGCVLGVLLMWYELDQHNPVLQQICNAAKKVNCNAILQSKASKIAGIGWSTIGFTYFMGQLLLFLFTGITSPETLFTLSWINVLALPYIFFSLYYQYRIAKQWCVLCLCVQGLLALQFVTAISGGWQTLIAIDALNSRWMVPVITAFAVPFISAILLIPILERAKESKRYQNELQRLKHNPQIFEALLVKQKAITESTEGLGITLGNPAAKYKLIKVCNPYCGPCAKAHVPMEELLANNPDVQIQIIFMCTNNEDDHRTPPAKHLLAIAEKNDETLIKQALDDWYLVEKNDYGMFAAKYPMNGELKKQDSKIEAMIRWCDETGIAFTPTFFISLPSAITESGQQTRTELHQLPEIYSVTDLKYFLTI